MSSKWVPVRDTILDALKIDVVTEDIRGRPVAHRKHAEEISAGVI